MNVEDLNNLSFANDVVLISETVSDLKIIIEEIKKKVKKAGFKINY